LRLAAKAGNKHESGMKVFGLTGGVGMGKSTAAQLLRERGVALVDTDDLARDVVQSGQPALEEVRKTFGNDILGPDGQLLREELARVVFADTEARKKLEAILHPRIADLWRARIELWRSEGQPLAVVVIPLLYETGAEGEFDAIVCVACTPATQRQRLRARGWTPEEIEQRIAAQMPLADKMARADYVIWTEGGLDVHAEQLDSIMPAA
jgi:dephospho-CoA kinase